MKAGGEACVKPEDPYLAEKLTPVQVQQGAALVVELLGQQVPPDSYTPSDCQSAQYAGIEDTREFGSILEQLEGRLSTLISIDDEQSNFKFPRVGWLTNALESVIIQDTFQYYLPAVHDLLQEPKIVDYYSGQDDLSAIGRMNSTLQAAYARAQRNTRKAILARGDHDEIIRYAAFDSLVPMLASQRSNGLPTISTERDRAGFASSTSSTLCLLKHIYITLDKLAIEGDQPDLHAESASSVSAEIAAIRADLAVATAECTTRREREMAIFEVAMRYTISSITPYAHSMMALSLEQFSHMREANGGQLANIAERTVPVAIGRQARQVRFQHEQVEPDSEDWHGSMAAARTWPSEYATYRCPSRRPAHDTTLTERFAELFGPEVHHRFMHSAADMSIYTALMLAGQYIPYLAEQHPNQSVADLLAKPIDD